MTVNHQLLQHLDQITEEILSTIAIYPLPEGIEVYACHDKLGMVLLNTNNETAFFCVIDAFRCVMAAMNHINYPMAKHTDVLTTMNAFYHLRLL